MAYVFEITFPSFLNPILSLNKRKMKQNKGEKNPQCRETNNELEN